MRVFISVDLSDQAKKEIGKLLKKLVKKGWDVKWENSDKLHQTLVFVGFVDNKKLLEIKETCRQVVKKLKPFKISFKGLGVFPDFDWPKVIWIGLKGDLKNLAFLEKTVRKELSNKGFSFSEKPFVPHITLGRIKRIRLAQRREIGRQIKALRKLDLKSEVLVDKIIIYESRLPRLGSKYFPIEKIKFS